MEVCLCRVASVGMVHLVIGTEQGTRHTVNTGHDVKLAFVIHLRRGHVLLAQSYLRVVHQLHHCAVVSTAGV